MYLYHVGEEMHASLEVLICLFLWINSGALVLICMFWPAVRRQL